MHKGVLNPKILELIKCVLNKSYIKNKTLIQNAADKPICLTGKMVMTWMLLVFPL